MNDLQPYPILPGFNLIAVDYVDLRGRLPLRDGMVVIVEQTTDDGRLREWSAKQIELYEDRLAFCPRSTNPKHKAIVIPRNDGQEQKGHVRVLAIVREISCKVPLS